MSSISSSPLLQWLLGLLVQLTYNPQQMMVAPDLIFWCFLCNLGAATLAQCAPLGPVGLRKFFVVDHEAEKGWRAKVLVMPNMGYPLYPLTKVKCKTLGLHSSIITGHQYQDLGLTHRERGVGGLV